MSNLLVANIKRLKKNRIFWIFVLGFFIASMFMVVMGWNVANSRGLDRSLDYYYFRTMMYAGLLYAAFISLFVGTEFSDGTVRNKLVVGHSRRNVYISNLLTNYLAITGLVIAWLIGGMAGIPLFGLWEVGIKGWAIDSLVILYASFVSASIYTLLAHCNTSKASCAVVSILLEFVLLMASSYFYSALLEPETTYSFMEFSGQGVTKGDIIQNPAYISGMMRDVYEWIVRILPNGQIAKVGLDFADLNGQGVMIAVAIVFSVIISFIGCILFEKKDLK